jgi:hypothetical protein
MRLIDIHSPHTAPLPDRLKQLAALSKSVLKERFAAATAFSSV